MEDLFIHVNSYHFQTYIRIKFHIHEDPYHQNNTKEFMN